MGQSPGRGSSLHAFLVLLGTLTAAMAAPGCVDDGGAPSGLELESALPRPEADPILLNDALRLTFSAPIDATTVTRRSVQLVDVESGVAARGSWDVDGRLLRFRPEGVRSASLDKGGYVPGRTYRLTVLGFPYLGALRTPGGVALDHSISLSYSVVAAAPRPETSHSGDVPDRRVLRDASPGRTAPLRILPGEPGSAETLPLQWDEALRLVCDEPLDPRSIDPADYELRLVTDARVVTPYKAETPPIPVDRITLEANEAEDVGMSPSRPGARLVVVPRTPFPVNDGKRAAFELRVRPDVEGMVDFSGGRAVQRARPVRFYVARHDVRSSERSDSYEFDFSDDFDFVPVLDPSSDGTARWSGNGRVEIRYPAAAGSGSAGAVQLAGAEARKDIPSTRMTLSEGETASLTGGGLVVLRAQGRVELRGLLTRSAGATEAPPMWNSERQLMEESMKDAESLSAWLRRARQEDHAWTVIIAGGDLIVSGQIDVRTPLLLVAGGRIRGAGKPRTVPGQLWLLGDGGGFELPRTANPNVVPPLLIDEPLVNPLVEPLTFVAISSPVPKGHRPTAWLDPLVLGGHGAAGEFDVQYLRAGALRRGEEGLGQAVRYDQPNLVVEPDSPGGAPVRLRIELVVRPRRGPWDPPYVDRVRLAWSPD